MPSCTNIRVLATWLVVVCIALSSFVSSSANSESADKRDTGLPLWELGAGIGIATTPHYPAGKGSRTRALPLPYVVYRGDFLRAGDGSLVSGHLFDSERIELDISLNGSFDADSDDVEIRQGMPDLGLLLEVGPELQWRLNDPANETLTIKLELPLRAVVAVNDGDVHAQGWVFNPEFELEWNNVVAANSQISLSLDTAWANEKLSDYFYSVQDEFQTPQRPGYAAKAGILQTSLSLNFKQRRGPRFMVAGIKYHNYSGAENSGSPLFQSNSSWTAYLGVAWSLWQSERRVKR